MALFSSALLGFTTLPSKVTSGPFCDIGLNLCDEMYSGMYNNKMKHETDRKLVLERAKSMGVIKNIITAGTVEQSKASMELVKEFNNMKDDNNNPIFDLYSTVGVHPTRCNEFVGQEDEVISQLSKLIEEGINNNIVVAIGEAGLDYDRLQFCDKEQQLKGFIKQIDLAQQFNLPMFLHNRNTNGDFVDIVNKYSDKIINGGVVHSFDGTSDELESLLNLGYYIGINGCSLRTEESLIVAASIPNERLLIETDSPWCSIKNSHPSMEYVKTIFTGCTKKRDKYESGYMVKDRNEPCTIVQVVEVLAALKDMDQQELTDIIYDNTCKLFFKGEK